MNQGSEKDWIVAAQNGDEDAFGALVRQHHVAIRAYLIARAGNAHDAEDLAQDTFITAFRKLPEFDPNRPIRPWLRGIAFKRLANYRKKHRPQYIGGNQELDAILSVAIDSKREAGGEVQRVEALQGCLKKLGQEARALVSERYLEGQSVNGICEKTGRKRSAVAMQLHRIRMALKTCIEGRNAS